MNPTLPSPPAIARLVGTLVDKVVRVANATERCRPAFVAFYVDDQGRDVFACLVDVGLVAVLGAALALIPPRVAAEAARSGTVEDLLVSNAYEVLNVLAAAFNEAAATGHVRLRALRPAADAPLAMLTALRTRADFDVTVTTYATGKLALVALPN